jgi:hypothetical protein
MNPVHKHEPAAGAFLIGHILDMGDGLHGACADLARDPTPERCDRLIMKLKGAEQALRQFRRALAADGELSRDPD